MEDKIIKNGFYVDPKTGECFDELVFDSQPRIGFIDEPYHFDSRKTKFGDPLIQKLNTCNTRDQNKHNIFKCIENFIKDLNFSYELNKTLKEQTLDANCKNSTKAIIFLCKIIYKRNLPITTKELFTIIENLKNKKIIKKAIGTPYRDYSWYINRLLSNFEFLSINRRQTIYKKILENYRGLSNILNLNSPAFISSLTYFSMKANFPNIKFKLFDFETKNPTVAFHKKRLKEIGIIL